MGARSRGRPAFCSGCGWHGQRNETQLGVPCPNCKRPQVILAGMGVSLPKDPRVVAAALLQDSELLWRVLRELQDTRVVGPWMPFPSGYWERCDLGGSRVASVRPHAVLGYEWEAGGHSGSRADLAEAMSEADQALIDWLDAARDVHLVSGSHARAG